MMKQDIAEDHEVKRGFQLFFAISKATFPTVVRPRCLACQISKLLARRMVLSTTWSETLSGNALVGHILAILAVTSWQSYLGIDNLGHYKRMIMCIHGLNYSPSYFSVSLEVCPTLIYLPSI